MYEQAKMSAPIGGEARRMLDKVPEGANSEISSLIMEIGNYLTALEENLAALEERIVPICASPDVLTKAPSTTAGRPPCLSQLGEQLQNRSSHIQLLNIRVYSLMQRIAL
jgi:hypothetical protein